MSIFSGDIQVLKSAVMADVPEGGGAPTGIAIVDGQSNSIFPDVTEVARAGGQVSLRKLHVGVLTDNTDAYMDANVIVAKPPEDPKVAVTLLTTKSTFDQRTAAANMIESYLIKGTMWPGFLLENHVRGQRSIQIFQRPTDPEVPVGHTIVLVINETLSTEKTQFVRVLRVSSVIRKYQKKKGEGTYDALVSTCDISDALRDNFDGSAPNEDFTPDAGKSILRDTTVADAGAYYGVNPLRLAARIGDFMATCGSIYTTLVPSSAIEKASLDVPASGTKTVVLSKVDSPTSRAVSTKLHAHTCRIKVTQESRGLTYTVILDPKPAVGTLEVSYLALGKWYTLYDTGVVTDNQGVLSGAVPGLGTGTIHYLTGSVAVTLAVLPDNASSVIFSWADMGAFTSRAGNVTVKAPRYTLELEKDNITVGSFSVSWTSGGNPKQTTDNPDGSLNGDATGFIDHLTGYLSLKPNANAYPDAGSQLVISYTYANVVRETKTGLSATGGGMCNIPLAQVPVHGTVKVIWMTTRTVSDTGGSSLSAGTSTKHTSNSSSTERRKTVRRTNDQGWDRYWQYQYNWQANAHQWGLGANQDTTVSYTSDTSVGSRSKYNVTSSKVSNNVIELMHEVTESGTLNGNGFGTFLKLPGETDPLGTIDHAGKMVTLRVVNPSTLTTSYRNDTESGMDFTASNSHSNSNVSTLYNAQFRPGETSSLGNSTSSNTSSQGGVWDTTSTSEVFDGTAAWVTYRTGTPEDLPHTQSYTPPGLVVDLTPYTTDRIIPGSVMFKWMGHLYRDIEGKLYRDGTDSSIGIESGTIDYGMGTADVTDYVVSATDTAFTLYSLWTTKGSWTTSKIYCRTPMAPVKPLGFVMSVLSVSGEQIIATADIHGVITGPHALGTIDYQTGVVDMVFGDLVEIAALTDAQKAEWWYAKAFSQKTAANKVWKPWPVDPSTFRFNSVGYYYLPLDADILGLDPVRLPSDGRVVVYRPGGFAVLGNSHSVIVNNPLAGDDYGPWLDSDGLPRVRLSRIRVKGNDGVVINTGYTVNLEAGTMHVVDPTGWPLPITIEHRVEDMVQVSDVQITGEVAFTRAITHNYPKDTSYLSSALICKDLFARVSVIFDQTSWDGTWSDSVNGTAASASFNYVQYPIRVTNRGALTERWCLKFTSTTAFHVIGEHIGQITNEPHVIGSTDYAPVNLATGVPYFTIDWRGWGGGWSSGMILRFNTVGAQYPIWLVRTVQQGPEPTNSDSSFSVLVRGDVDTV